MREGVSVTVRGMGRECEEWEIVREGERVCVLRKCVRSESRTFDLVTFGFISLRVIGLRLTG